MVRYSSIQELQSLTDLDVIVRLITDRTSRLNLYSPLAKRLGEIRKKIDENLPLTSPHDRKFVWLRIGDQGDYGASETMEETAEVLARFTKGPLKFSALYQVEAPEWKDKNNISLYWGKADLSSPDPIRGFSKEELDYLNSCLVRERREVDSRQ